MELKTDNRVGTGVTLLVTDRPDLHSEREHQIGRVSRCCKIAVGDLASFTDPTAAVVLDVALDDVSTIQHLTGAMARYRRSETPVVCLLHDNGRRSHAQADSLGATKILSPNASADLLISTLLGVIGPDAAPPAMAVVRPEEAGAQGTCQVLAEMLKAAGRDNPIDNRIIDMATPLVIETIAEAGIHKWLEVVWRYDDVTYQHCLLVAGFAAAFAQALGFSTNDHKRLTKAALVHDLGKAKIPLAILNKPGKLSSDEMAIMRTHARLGYDILIAQGNWEAELLDVVLHHHEYLDGSGYPDGLAASKISDLVRLMTICDIYAALVERRPYKAPVPIEAAFGILKSMDGKLEGALVDRFGTVVARAAA